MIDSSKYKNFDKIQALKSIAEQELLSCDWRKLKDYLVAQPKDDNSNDGPSWHYQEGFNDVQIYSYQDSLTAREETGIESSSCGDWLCLTFIDKCFKKQTPNTEVAKIFNRTWSKVLELQGINHFSIHFVSPKFTVVKHRDDAGKIYSLLIKLQSSNFKNEILSLTLTDDLTYNLIDKEYFTFDPEIEHCSTNESSKDWIFIMLRINQEYFNE